MEITLETLRSWVYIYALKVTAALVIFVLGRWISRKVSALIGRIMERQTVDVTVVGFVRGIVYYSLLVVVITAAASQLGINTSSFLAVMGAAGLAVGLALKDSLSNFAAGVMLILFRPFRVGDFVTAGGISGSVQSISLFNTILHTGDNQKIIVPNSKITGEVITNVTANPTRRIDLVAGIGYEDDIDEAKEVINSILASEGRILKDPPPQIAVAELADSSVNIVVRPWVRSQDYWPVRFSLTEKIKKEFDKVGLSIPYPQQDVHLFVETTDGGRQG